MFSLTHIDRLSWSQPRHWNSCGFWTVLEHRHTALRTVTRSHTHARMGDGWIDCRESVFGRAYLIRITIETSVQQQHSVTSKHHRYWTLAWSIIVKASSVMRIDICVYIYVQRNISMATAFHDNQIQLGTIGNAVYSCRHYTQWQSHSMSMLVPSPCGRMSKALYFADIRHNIASSAFV